MALIMAVALQIFVQITFATTQQRKVNRKNFLAMEASRSTIEHLRGLDLGQVFALYNDDPSDDPGGPGTAPGPYFVVSSLTPIEAAFEGNQGQLIFPVDSAEPSILREDVDNRDLGLPRDMDGDGVIDGEDHSLDYSILPVEVRVVWRGQSGRRQLSQHVLLTEMKQ